MRRIYRDPEENIEEGCVYYLAQYLRWRSYGGIWILIIGSLIAISWMVSHQPKPATYTTAARATIAEYATRGATRSEFETFLQQKGFERQTTPEFVYVGYGYKATKDSTWSIEVTYQRETMRIVHMRLAGEEFTPHN